MIRRTEHSASKKFTIITRTLAQNRKLSFQARGLLLYILSKPDGWQAKDKDLMKQGGIGKHAYGSILNELKAAGYAHRIEHRNDRGKFEYSLEISEEPEVRHAVNTVQPLPDFPVADNPSTEDPVADNRVAAINSTRTHAGLSQENRKKERVPPEAEWTPEKNTHSADIATKATRYAKPKNDRPAIIIRIGELTPNERTGKPTYPARALWPQFVEIFGEEWDDQRLAQRHTLWLTRGHKPTNWAWALEWYLNEPKSNTTSKPAPAPYDPDYQAIVADYGDYYYVEAANHDGGTSPRWRTAEAFAAAHDITVDDVLRGNGGTREGTHWKTVEECPHHPDSVGGGNRPITVW